MKFLNKNRFYVNPKNGRIAMTITNLKKMNFLEYVVWFLSEVFHRYGSTVKQSFKPLNIILALESLMLGIIILLWDLLCELYNNIYFILFPITETYNFIRILWNLREYDNEGNKKIINKQKTDDGPMPDYIEENERK